MLSNGHKQIHKTLITVSSVMQSKSSSRCSQNKTVLTAKCSTTAGSAEANITFSARKRHFRVRKKSEKEKEKVKSNKRNGSRHNCDLDNSSILPQIKIAYSVSEGDKRLSDNPKVPKSNTVIVAGTDFDRNGHSRLSEETKSHQSRLPKNSRHLSSSPLSLPTHNLGAHVGITLKKKGKKKKQKKKKKKKEKEVEQEKEVEEEGEGGGEQKKSYSSFIINKF
ncbi:hypothetical protein LSTR_LSTR007953 [Laodelphax striatellus]|uniref:Uncharacterized protein n=1 Tax=Laodelphax striatellus TaxID=195883 RepID=A0A482XGF2_LAOST|nr:hypothetical protein LSTR_LSTR007953 [Laodelphax striatellus]